MKDVNVFRTVTMTWSQDALKSRVDMVTVIVERVSLSTAKRSLERRASHICSCTGGDASDGSTEADHGTGWHDHRC